MTQAHYKISDVTNLTGLSADTLRYYERIGLLHNVLRTPGGARRYSEANLVTLGFIKRAQKMNFSLADISELLQMRVTPGQACQDVQQIARTKLTEIESHIQELKLLRHELQSLVNQCAVTDAEGCAVLEGLEKES